MPRTYVIALYWLLLVAALAVAAVVLWHQGMFQVLFESDVSRISTVILAVFSLATCHAGYFLYRFSRETDAVCAYDRLLRSLPPADRPGALASGEQAPPRLRKQLSIIARGRVAVDARSGLENQALFQLLDTKIKAPVRLGWLLSDLLIKLGLLGTVIGFILMLGAISGGAAVDISNIDALLTDMGSGMRVALFTTLAGLTAGTLLGFQYFIVERAADELLARIIEMIEMRLIDGYRQDAN